MKTIKSLLTGAIASTLLVSTQAQAENKPVITVAYTNYYVPYDFVNDKGEAVGIEVAILKEVEKKLPQYEFKYVPTSDDDLLIGVESGKYTVGTKGIWITEPRKKKYVFPKHNISASVVGIVIRKENANEIKDLDSFASFSGKLVPIAPQDARYSIIADFNKNTKGEKIKLLPSEAFQISDAYTWVLEGRYDAYLEIELSYKNNIANEGAPYHKFADKLNYIRYKGVPTYPIFNKKQQQFADEYDNVIEDLEKDGTIAKLEEKYFGERLSAYLGK